MSFLVELHGTGNVHLHLQVIAEDVAAVIIHCGAMPQPAQPSHCLPAFPEAATTNHEANDDHNLHETREFWGRLQPQSLVPLLQSASSKGKGRMPSSYLPIQPPSSAKGPANGHLPSGHLPITKPSPRQSLPSQASHGDAGAASSSQSESLLAYDSSPSAARQEGRQHTSMGGRSVHFALPLGVDSSDELDADHDRDQSEASSPEAGAPGSSAHAPFGVRPLASKVPERSPPLDISFRSAPQHAMQCMPQQANVPALPGRPLSRCTQRVSRRPLGQACKLGPACHHVLLADTQQQTPQNTMKPLLVWGLTLLTEQFPPNPIVNAIINT